MRFRRRCSIAWSAAQGCAYTAAAFMVVAWLLYVNGGIRADVFVRLIGFGLAAIIGGTTAAVCYPVGAVVADVVRARRSR